MNRKFLLVLTCVVLGLLSCNQPNGNNAVTTNANVGKIAYINMDTLMTNYQLAKDLNEKFTQKQENMMADLNVKAKKVEDMIKSFQYRLKNNAFATRARAEKEQKRIEKKRQELLKLDQTMKANLAEEYQTIVKRLQDTIKQSLEAFNKTRGYDLILRTTEGGNVLLGKPQLNITSDFLKQLNASYAPTKAKK